MSFLQEGEVYLLGPPVLFLQKEQAKQIGYVGKSAYNFNVALMSTAAAFQLCIAHLDLRAASENYRHLFGAELDAVAWENELVTVHVLVVYQSMIASDDQAVLFLLSVCDSELAAFLRERLVV